MKRIILCLLAAFACNFAVMAQNTKKMNYDEQWKKIDILLQKDNLPKSALTEIQKVYTAAFAEKEYGQWIKAIIYRMNCQAMVEENTIAVMLDSLKHDAEIAPQPAKSVVYSLIGSVYHGFFQSNRWQISQRTRAAIDETDIYTWDASKIIEEAIKYYNLSVQDERGLQQTPIDNYNAVLQNYLKGQKLLPTLYDFLVRKAIDALRGDMGVASPQQTFVINEPCYFADAATFAGCVIKTNDTLSFQYQALVMYQKLIKFRLQQVSTDGFYPLINADIDRLKFIKSNGRYADNDILYETALKELMEKYNNIAEWSYAAYALAELYNEQGMQWRTSKNDKYRMKRKEAYELCSQIIAKYPDSEIGGRYASDLQAEIKSSSAVITMEKMQPSGTSILALIKYRNLGKAYLSIYKLTNGQTEESNNGYFDCDDLDKAKPYATSQVELPYSSDYQDYSAEIKIGSLPQGNYAVLVSETSKPYNEYAKGEDDDDEDKLWASATFQVSSLTAVLRNAGYQNGIAKQTTSNRRRNELAQIYVTDSKTGEPAKKAKIDIYMKRYVSSSNKYVEYLYETCYTDDWGIAYTKFRDDDASFKKAIITQGAKRLELYQWNAGGYYYEQGKNNNAIFFTDRSIYRPGQTVYYKVLFMQSNGDGDNQLQPQAQIGVRLRDVNYKDIAHQQLTTNEYGTAQGSFTIPQGLLNGGMTLVCDNGGSIGIQVEEYKRPTFEVKFDPVKQNYKLNDNVQVTGVAKALAGYAVDNSKVQYRVTREARYRLYRWWFPPITSPLREITSGEVTTDSKGAFTIDFKAEADDVKNNDLIYNYTVTADITDANGETRSAVLDVQISNKPLLVQVNIPSRILNNDSLAFKINTTNLNGDFTPADVVFTVTALKAPERILRNRLWEMPDTFAISRDEFEKNFPSDPYGDENMPEKYAVARQLTSFAINTQRDKKADFSALRNAKTGWYRIDIKAKNEQGIEVEQQEFVQLVSSQPSPILGMDEWLTVVKSSGEPGENAEFWIAGGEKKSYVRYELLFKNTVVEQQMIETGTTPRKIIIPIKEEYRGGFAVQFVMVQNNRTYSLMNEINVPYSNKQLDIAFTTFRDKLLPGEKEKWTLTVKSKQGEKQMAEMAATLYDASLDAFRPHSWSDINRFYSSRNHYYFAWHPSNYNQIEYSRYCDYDEYNAGVYFPRYAGLETFGGRYTWLYNNHLRVRSQSLRTSLAGRLSGVVAESVSESDHVWIRGTASLDEVVVVGYGTQKKETTKQMSLMSKEKNDAAPAPMANSIDGGSGTPPLTDIATRQNFNETAFFYPQLRTDENGEISIEFTIPEALTRWKMLGFAHTLDFKIGNVTNELITQKQVAISANAPRFFRENDVIEFTAKVNNITEGDLSGQALLRLYDATTMQPVDAQIIKSAQMQNFSVKAGESTGLKWTLAIPAGIQAITYKVTAQAGSHTDGEEKIVPVLTNSMLVTETMPFSIRAGQEKTFTFDRLKNNNSTTLRNHKLTLEFTSNPAWYAIQAMPYIMEYPYECAEQTFARFYANSLSSTIVNSSPRVKQVFDLWRNLPDSKALLSNLEKNQELKQVMLEETPWVMQANNETERKKRVGLLFDLNKMSEGQQRAFDKLKKAQLPEGGFAWFNGLQPSQYITQHIVAGMEHLKKLDALNENYKTEATQMVQNGLRYLDRCIKSDYDNLIKYKTKLDQMNIGSVQLHYLYACSFSEHKPQDAEQRKAFDYYYNQAATYWMKFSIYNQGMAALALNRLGNKETAAKIIASLKERAQYSEEMGMYWKDNIAGYFWYQAPIETQAMLIEAFNEVANDAKAVEEMKIWLLRNKQTNDWKTTKATSEATYALLMTGSNLLDENQPIDIKVGGKPLAEATTENVKPEPGTGYVKTAWNGSDIAKDMAVMNVKNPNKNGIAWGGMYWQYFEQLDKITSAETNLRMNKQLFLKKITERGAELLPLNESNVLKVGDVVKVRMELRADRDYEYVHLKDMRAAGFEPVSAISGHRYQDGLWYYESIKDASINFFISYLRKGTYVFEYELRVTHAGEFSNGITTFQCMYAPEFSAHSEGVRVTVE